MEVLQVDLASLRDYMFFIYMLDKYLSTLEKELKHRDYNTDVRFRIINALINNRSFDLDRSMTVIELANVVDRAKSSISRIAVELASRGLISRRQVLLRCGGMGFAYYIDPRDIINTIRRLKTRLLQYIETLNTYENEIRRMFKIDA